MRQWTVLLVPVFCLHPAFSADVVEQRSLFEASFSATGDYSNPYVELEPSATVLRPGGSTWTIPLFWDGDSTWRLRLSPNAVGSWSYRVSSADPGLDGQRGAFSCVPSARRGGIIPMDGHPRHFQYENGEPMWFLADTAWGYFTDIAEEGHDREQSERYVKVRAGQGFNVIHSMLLSEGGDGNAGGPPFDEIAGQWINPAYWREVDRRLQFANRQGVSVGLAIAWGDKRKQEPYAWRRFPNVEARRRYTRYVAARYSGFSVYFLVSGEWHAEARTRENTTQEAVMREFVSIGETLAAADPHDRMIGIHPMTAKGSVREFNAASWMSFADYQQNYADLHGRMLLSQRIPKPLVNSEYGYYLRDQDGNGETDKANSFSAEDMRYASWDLAMAGGYFVTGFGTTYFGGHREPGEFNIDAPANDDWEEQIQHIKSFFRAIGYWKLIPADELVSSPTPRGADRSVQVSRGNRRVGIPRPPAATYWAMTIPGEAYVVYVRGLDSEVRLEFDSRAGDFNVRQYNPRTGEFASLGTVSGGMDYRYKPPDSADWIVLLERIGRN